MPLILIPAAVKKIVTVIEEVVLLMSFNGNLLDQSQREYQFSSTGQTSYSTVSPKFGSYLRLPQEASVTSSVLPVESPLINLPGDSTIEFWVRFDSRTWAGTVEFFGVPNTGILADGGNILIRLPVAGYIMSGIPMPAANVWSHFALTCANGVHRFFIDGVLQATTASSARWVTSSGRLKIGSTAGNGNTGFGMDIDDIRVTNGLARYTANFTPSAVSYALPPDPSISNVSLLMHMNGTNNSNTFVDEKGKSVSFVGAPVLRTDIKKFGTASAYFNGSSYLTVPDSSDFDFGSSDFTVEFWMRTTRTSLQEVFTKGVGLQMYINDGQIAVALSANNTGSYFINASAVAAVPVDTWMHIALVLSGNFYYLFVNGVRYVLVETALRINTGAGQVAIGAYTAGNASQLLHYYGFMDEVRVTKGIARYTQNFTVASEEFSNS